MIDVRRHTGERATESTKTFFVLCFLQHTAGTREHVRQTRCDGASYIPPYVPLQTVKKGKKRGGGSHAEGRRSDLVCSVEHREGWVDASGYVVCGTERGKAPPSLPPSVPPDLLQQPTGAADTDTA